MVLRTVLIFLVFCRTTYSCIISAALHSPLQYKRLLARSPQALSFVRLVSAAVASCICVHVRVSMETDDSAATRRPVAQPDAAAATSSAKNEFMPWVRYKHLSVLYAVFLTAC